MTSEARQFACWGRQAAIALLTPMIAAGPPIASLAPGSYGEEQVAADGTDFLADVQGLLRLGKSTFMVIAAGDPHRRFVHGTGEHVGDRIP